MPRHEAGDAAAVAARGGCRTRIRLATIGPVTHASTSKARPLASMLLIAHEQQHTVGEAIAGALAQTYTPLEIVISDDASGDATWDAMQRAVAGYAGPHRVLLNRNPANLGIGVHLSRLVELSHGELLFVTAGDDVSLPGRVARTIAAWEATGRRVDLIASPLIDIDADGRAHGELRPSDLASYAGAADWLARPPYVVGAGQAWTRRLFERFGPLPAGTVAEDLILVFRAIVSGGAITLDEPLVRYRRGGLSGRRRALRPQQVRERLANNARHSLVELPQLLADAERAGVGDQVAAGLQAQLRRERHIAAQIDGRGFGERLRRFVGERELPLALRLRVLMYAAFPQLAAPWFALKRLALRHGGPEAPGA